MTPSDEQKIAHANDLRESEKYGESAKEYTDCLVSLIDKKDYTGIIHCLSGQSHIYKILSRKINSPIYRHLTLAFSSESLEVLSEHGSEIDLRTQSIALSSHGDALLMDNRPSEALPFFEKALSLSPAQDPEKGRLKCHIGGIKYLLGEKQTALSLIEDGLQLIRTGDMSAYHIRVWETGALNALAKIFALDNDFAKAESLARDSLSISQKYNLTIREREISEILQKISQRRTDFSL